MPIKRFFKGRVLFTIHSVSGKVLGFGGRTLLADKNIPKYINSPETDIYIKSRIVYGIHFARKAIAQNDVCYLVEGYMDVLSMHQAGIENTVASSGTSLTQDQVKLIRRYTNNLTIVYDGDAAGVKAALRGLEIALEEGMAVKVVLLPKEHDPDTYVREHGSEAFLAFIRKSQKDLIHLKTDLFLDEANGDPVKIAQIVKDIVQSIARIPDSITRSLYLKQTARMLQVEEQLLISETNRFLRKKAGDRLSEQDRASVKEQPEIQQPQEARTFTFHLDEPQERDIIRLLLENSNFEVEGENAIGKILKNLQDVEIENPLYRAILNDYKVHYDKDEFLSQAYFINHTDPAVRQLIIDMLQTPYELSENWFKMHDVVITDKQFLVKKDIVKSISLLKLKKILKMRDEVEAHIRSLTQSKTHDNVDEIQMCMKELIQLQDYIKKLSADTGTVILPANK
ncbi:MAG: toprim domain-containing protein [Chitinophagales bacterium]